jgi:hypothetical protein
VHFHEGIKCRSLGYHPLFHAVKSVYRMKEKPKVIAGLLMLFGYVFASLKGLERPVPENFITYLRSEQLARLKVLFTRGKDPALWC